MKKHFLFFAMAVAAMTSCMKDEVVASYEPAPQAIGFESFVNKTTKAVTATDSDIQKFYAYAYYSTTPVFEGVTVTKVADAWDHNGEDKYWTANNYYFGAYANGNNADPIANVSFADGTLTIPSYTVTDANDLVADVLTVNNTALSNQTVGFTFDHLLTKIKFTVQNTSEYTMKISSALTINGAKETGTCTVTGNGATWASQTGDITYTPIAASSYEIAVGASVPSEEMLVLPQSLANITYSITAEFYDENGAMVIQKSLTDITIDPTTIEKWAPGTSYNYIIGMPYGATEITFAQPTVNGWTSYGSNIQLNPDQQ